jgi:hypothetical protein
MRPFHAVSGVNRLSEDTESTSDHSETESSSGENGQSIDVPRPNSTTIGRRARSSGTASGSGSASSGGGTRTDGVADISRKRAVRRCSLSQNI